MYSDGYSDNIFVEDYANCLKEHVKENKRLENLSGAAICSASNAYTLGK